MKVAQQRKNKRRNGKTYRLFTLMFIPILLTIFLFMASFRSAELNNFTPKSSILNNLTLLYNSIDASNFPRIVSLVNVVDEAGIIIQKLDTSNFEVHEDNVRERPIEVVELFSPESPPKVVLTIDGSSSMSGTPLQNAKKAAVTFVNLMHGNDRSAVVHFSDRAHTDIYFSGNKDSLTAAINQIRYETGTAIFDALLHSADLLRGVTGNRVIIIMTDGEDHDSDHTYEDVLQTVIPMEVRIFTIGLRIDADDPEEIVLRNLASKTGGLYYRSPSSSDLESIYRAISGILHHLYQISYTTHNPAKDGTLRHVQIDVMVNASTSWDTASYRAPYEGANGDTVRPPDPVPPEPAFEVVPNPFTPNDDGFNDWAEFKRGDDTPVDWNICIMDRSGRIIQSLSNGERIWDGKDKSGKVMLPGFYLYTISKDNKVIHRGLIQLIR
jgi:VWFA-related protein